MVGYALAPGVWLKDKVTYLWQSYLALVGVAQENARLREDLALAQQELAGVREDQKELERLRRLLDVPALDNWSKSAARVIAMRFGPHAGADTLLINKGFAGGATVGCPAVTRQGLLGRVYKMAAHTSTVLLLTDPGFRVAVISQESRVRGILAGTGRPDVMEMRYVAQNAQIKPGELLVSSGVEGTFPKGIPVAKVQSVRPGHEILFLQVNAAPVVNPENVEEVVLLIPPRDAPQTPVRQIDPDVQPVPQSQP